MPDRKRLFIVDGHALAFRSFYAMMRQRMTNSQGEELGAVYGFATTNAISMLDVMGSLNSLLHTGSVGRWAGSRLGRVAVAALVYSAAVWCRLGKLIAQRGAAIPIERKKELKRRRQRKKRVGKLKEQLAEAKTIAERERLIELIRRRQPFFTPPEK